jgi:hypothetical protein
VWPTIAEEHLHKTGKGDDKAYGGVQAVQHDQRSIVLRSNDVPRDCKRGHNSQQRAMKAARMGRGASLQSLVWIQDDFKPE